MIFPLFGGGKLLFSKIWGELTAVDSILGGVQTRRRKWGGTSLIGSERTGVAAEVQKIFWFLKARLGVTKLSAKVRNF